MESPPVFTSRTSFPSLLTLLTLLAPLTSAFAIESATDKETKATRTDVAPVIDGRLDDAVWQSATVIEDLHQVTPDEFAAPTERTVVYLLYDTDNLYVGARMFDGEPAEIVARILRQNQPIGGDDRFFVHIDAFGNRRSGNL